VDYGNGRGLFGASGWARRGEIVSIVGPNGAGKSTLVRILALLLSAQSGRLRAGDWSWDFATGTPSETEADRVRRHSVGAVLQRTEPWPHKTAVKFVQLPLRRALGLAEDVVRRRAHEAMEQFGVANREGAYAHRLSGGLKQRVALAQAMAMRRPILLLDEATEGLDAEWEERLRCMLRQFAQDGGTVVNVSHRMGFMRRLSDRLILLDAGRVVAQGTMDEIMSSDLPASSRAFLENS